MIGDWWERRVVAVLLAEVADELGLFLDHRFVRRTCRTGRVLWKDEDGNNVDYDFVLELEGSPDHRGIPVGFIESFWRGGSRHSKDKARDDTNKLLPMRDTYPTARLLAMAACGEFSGPAREYVMTRLVDLFYIPKSKVIEAFKNVGIDIDYPDTLSEDGKKEIAERLQEQLTPELEVRAANELRSIAGESTFANFKSRVLSSLSAVPQEIWIVESERSEAMIFEDISSVTEFLENPVFVHSGRDASYEYNITYSDGFEFSRKFGSIEGVKKLNEQVDHLVKHVESILKAKTSCV